MFKEEREKMNALEVEVMQLRDLVKKKEEHANLINAENSILVSKCNELSRELSHKQRVIDKVMSVLGSEILVGS
jgi:hypothetical protein